MQTIDRREFLKISGFMSALATLSACQALPTTDVAAASANPSSPTLTPTLMGSPGDSDWEIFQTLRRITFGPRSEEIARAREIGIDNFIDEQLAPKNINDDLSAHLDPLEFLTLSPEDLFAVEKRGQVISQLSQATALRAIYSKRQLYELMVNFWNNHFSVYVLKNVVGALKVVDDREVIRPHALGNFHDLLSASAHSPAMLAYLDNAQSSKESPNENYARELLELHTLGVDGGYAHDVVVEVARALTGWSASGRRSSAPGYFEFHARAHDTDAKTILGQAFPAGQSIEDGEQLLELLAEHPSTAQFISTKLVRRFVADDPPSALVSAAAATFTQTGGDITQMMSIILHSDEFKASLGTKLKQPFEYIISTLRMTGASVSGSRLIGQMLKSMGQPIFQRPTPDGYPDSEEAWVTTNGMLSRWNYALGLAFNTTRETKIDWDSLSGDSSDTGSILGNLSATLLGTSLSTDEQKIVVDFANSLPSDYITPAIGALLMASPYYQYR